MKKTKRKVKVVKPRTTFRKQEPALDLYTVTEKGGLFYLANTTRKEQALGPFSTLAKASEFARNANGRVKASPVKALRILG